MFCCCSLRYYLCSVHRPAPSLPCCVSFAFCALYVVGVAHRLLSMSTYPDWSIGPDRFETPAHDDVSNHNLRRGSLKECWYQVRLPHQCTHMVLTATSQAKAGASPFRSSAPSEARVTHEPTHRFPDDIVGMIIGYLVGDLDTLKACSLTGRSWYIATVPHLHHTLTLERGSRGPDLTCRRLKPLSKLHELGLPPYVKEVRVVQGHCGKGPWFRPQAFDSHDLLHFSAFANVHTLRIEELEIHHFMPDIERYFGYLSPALRSITLFNPCCTPRQLSHFLSLFSNLDDIEILRCTPPPDPTRPDAELVPFSAPKLRGRLALHHFHQVETWTDLVGLCGGLRFRHVNLCNVGPCAPVLLDACAETLESLRTSALIDSFGQ